MPDKGKNRRTTELRGRRRLRAGWLNSREEAGGRRENGIALRTVLVGCRVDAGMQ